MSKLSSLHRRKRLLAMLSGLFVAPMAQAVPDWTAVAGDGNWTSVLNWSTGVAPGVADVAVFGSAGSGGSNLVDQNFTIGGLTYNANSTHTMNIGLGTELQVLGPILVGVGAPTNGATTTWGSGGQVTIGAPGAAQNLWVGVNNSSAASGTTTGQLFLEDIQVGGSINNLSIGSKVPYGTYMGGSVYGGGNANGALVLGGNSVLSVGTASARANVNVGINNSGTGTVTGLLDARQGVADFHATNFIVGHSGGGAATGTFRSGAQTTVDATQINVGTGSNATGTFELGAGDVKAQTITLGNGGNFIFTGGRLGFGTFNGTLNQEGGILAPGYPSGIGTINGNYNLSSAGVLEFDLNGTTVGSLYDRLVVNGMTQLNADSGLGGWLDIRLGYAANIGDSFLILDNNLTDPIAGYFRGLAEGSQFTEAYGGFLYTFQISYVGGTGNDVTLNTINVASASVPPAVPEPETWAMLLAGLGLLSFAARRKKNCAA
jgi:hypothetical protein